MTGCAGPDQPRLRAGSQACRSRPHGPRHHARGASRPHRSGDGTGRRTFPPDLTTRVTTLEARPNYTTATLAAAGVIKTNVMLIQRTTTPIAANVLAISVRVPTILPGVTVTFPGTAVGDSLSATLAGTPPTGVFITGAQVMAPNAVLVGVPGSASCYARSRDAEPELCVDAMTLDLDGPGLTPILGARRLHETLRISGRRARTGNKAGGVGLAD